VCAPESTTAATASFPAGTADSNAGGIAQEQASESTMQTPAPAGCAEEGQSGAESECPRRVLLQAGTDEESLKALALCQEKVTQLHLRMHPLAARWESDRHVVIFFRADDKVDFRKLVRELSRLLHARIELRQVGPREQGKLCGLVGKCGYPLCCQTFLGQFAQSTIKMAKTQELALNPMKISGVCGRLLCCLNYEQEMYLEAKSRMPRVNKMVQTEFGPGRVIAVNVFKETVTVQLETMTKELRPDQVQLSEVQG
jgi:cell fate regulator YaaT (PSP1 superfamily)